MLKSKLWEVKILRIKMKRVATTESLEKGRSITLKELGLGQKDKARFVKNCEVLEGVDISTKTFYVPG